MTEIKLKEEQLHFTETKEQTHYFYYLLEVKSMNFSQFIQVFQGHMDKLEII